MNTTKTTMKTIFTIAVLAGLLAACVPGAAPVIRPTATPDAWQRAIAGDAAVANAEQNAVRDAISQKQPTLLQALALVPDTAEATSFTDWARVKESAGFATVTGASDATQQTALTEWAKAHTPFAAFAFAQIDTHAKDWGWNTYDVHWEVATRVGEYPVYILKLRDDVDLAAIQKNFAARKFGTFNYLGAKLFTFGGAADWATTSQRSIANTAFLEDEKVIIMSTNAQSVRTVLELNAKTSKMKSSLESEALSAAAKLLSTKPSAFLANASFACKTIETIAKEQNMNDATLNKYKESFGNNTVHAYSAFGLGYETVDGKTVGTVVLHYAKADDAQADMPIRQNDLKNGMSLDNQKPYAELLTLDKASVQDNNLVLQVLPTNNNPKTFRNMISRQDTVYARCPQASREIVVVG